MKLSILDTETTGLDPRKDFLIEVAVVNFDTQIKDIIDCRSLVINQDLPADIDGFEYAQGVHGISRETLENYGHTMANAEGLILEAVLRSDAILAHNAEFDRQWLVNTGIHDMPWVCTQNDIKWPRIEHGKSLAATALAHGVGIVSAHRAIEDCLTIARLLKRVAESQDLDAMIAHAMRPKAKFKALVGFADKELAKRAGFRWDAEQKIWSRTMAIDDVAGLPFETRRLGDETNHISLF